MKKEKQFGNSVLEILKQRNRYKFELAQDTIQSHRYKTTKHLTKFCIIINLFCFSFIAIISSSTDIQRQEHNSVINFMRKAKICFIMTFEFFFLFFLHKENRYNNFIIHLNKSTHETNNNSFK